MILFALGLIGVFLGLGGASEVRRAERHAASTFSALLGPKSEVKVRIGLSGIASIHGDLASMDVRARNFSIDRLPLYVDPTLPRTGRIKRLHLYLESGTAKEFAVDLLEVTLTECRFDFKAARKGTGVDLSACDEGTFRLEATEASMASAAMRRMPSLEDAKVTIDPEGVHLDANSKSILGITHIRVGGSLQIRDGHVLALKNPQLWLNGKPVGADSAASALSGFDPLMDFDKDFALPGTLKLEQVILLPGRLALTGRIRIPIKPTGEYPAKR